MTAADLLATPGPDGVTPAEWRRDLEVLLCHVCTLDRADLIRHPGQTVDAAAERRFAHLVEKHARGVPVPYLTGTREFWSLSLHVTDATLIPRPETELLVEEALALIPAAQAFRVADIGTGSGTIAIALALERPHAEIVASDISPAALAIARANAARLGAKLAFVEADAVRGLQGLFDLIISNPPYIQSGDPCLRKPPLSAEPMLALNGGPDGLDIIRRISFGARDHLRKGGVLLLEHGYDQKVPVAQLLARYGYADIRHLQDLNGHPRVVHARWGSADRG